MSDTAVALQPPSCSDLKTVPLRVRTYAFCCGTCRECTGWATEQDPLTMKDGKPSVTDLQRAWLLALDDLGGDADVDQIEEESLTYLDRDACAGGWHDSLNRIGFRMAELGLAGRRVVGRRTRWFTTDAGRVALRLYGRSPSDGSSDQTSLL